MTDERDPALEKLFAIARQEPPGDAFVAAIMAEIHRLRRRLVVGWTCVGLLLVIGAGLLTGPVVEAVELASQLLPRSLVQLEERWLARLMAPVNTIAAPVGLGVLLLRLACRKIFRQP